MRNKILEMLEVQRGEYVSEEAMAEKFGVSCAAVNKAVVALKNQGYRIEAATGRGYCLCVDCDKLSEAGIRKYLKNIQRDIIIYEETDSTNLNAKQEMRSGRNAVLVAAEYQSCGRGRLGKNFYSPKSSGVYITVGFRPRVGAEKTLFLTVAAAVAAARTIDQLYGIETQIKWVNDIYYQGKKLCGILTEAEFEMESGGISYAVIGIGINTKIPREGFPEDICHKAGAISQFSDRRVLRNQLIAEFCNRLDEVCAQMETLNFLQEYKNRSCLIGKRVTVLQTGAESKKAEVLAIDDSAHLVVRTEDGKIASLSSGEVSILAE